ncbi:MAG: UDP-N-acetylmuramoyl-L-alanine--D-glutamate ligase [Clostridia bacterium]|nr:UDP-N-acetylmuramoyl-L-alanine--D-glutamate ligase [Clostridia bacterium]
MYPLKQSFFVLGLSRSGVSAAKYLLSRGATVFIYDDVSSEKVQGNAAFLEEQGAKRVSKEEISKMHEQADALILSPGIPIDHPIAIAFRRAKKGVMGETELAARCLRCQMVAITGTNGKTTTVSMITETLKKGGKKAFSCGNIGQPMLDYSSAQEEEIAVAEISSFQLETLNSLRAHVSVVLNVTEDHLNRHYNMENYLFLKEKILKNCAETEYAVLNYDDELVRSFSERTKAKTVYFSMRKKINGAYYENGNLYFCGEKILSANELSIGGVHNVQNALATIAVCKLFGVSTEKIRVGLKEFKGIRHRIETLATVQGVCYVNDSKATNVDATLKAVACMKTPTVLLLGGKGGGFFSCRFCVL